MLVTNKRLALCGLAIAFLLAGPVDAAPTTSSLLAGPVDTAPTISKSQQDDREYEYFVLSNKLQVILISDPSTDKAAAALDVRVGSADDPKDRQGLAHFLEHMLFLGTKEYPDADEYQAYIKAHGGRHNAYTAFESTNYFFDIDKDFLEPALDRFSRFFVSPLFNAAYVDRERKAVHSEYQANLKDDGRRSYSVLQQIVNPAHPASTFNVGSLTTLADRPDSKARDELVNFYRERYSANLMTLVVLGKEPLDQLQQWAREKFSMVVNRDAKALQISEPLYTPGTLPARVDLVPINEERSLTLAFPMPAVRPYYTTKPADYIANLIGHEGKGSLLSLLKERGWADGLAAGLGLDSRDSASFVVSITLTKSGLTKLDDIIAHVFQYIDLIRTAGIEAWRFEEQSRLYQVSYRFQEKANPLAHVSGIAASLENYPPHDVLYGQYRLDRFDPALIKQFTAKLTPNNVVVSLVAPDQATDQRDPWYDTPYSVSKLSPANQSRWSAIAKPTALALPAVNDLIAERLEVKDSPKPTAKPIELERSAGFELWHHQDPSFKQPRAGFYFSVRSIAANSEPTHAVLTSLFVSLLKDDLNEFSYPALLAGLHYELYPHVRGFAVRISGFDDKQDRLLEPIVTAIRTLDIKPKRFAIAKAELIRGLENTKNDPPYRQTMTEVRNLLVQPYWTVDQRLAVAPTVSIEDLRNFVPLLLQQINVVALAHGNVTEAEARTAGEILKSQLLAGARATEVPPAHVVELQAGTGYTRTLEIDHPDSAITSYYQGSDTSWSTRAHYELLGQIIAAPFFADLRTDKQLGYIVFAGSTPYLDVPGASFVVQSPNTDASALTTYARKFLSDFRTALTAMDAETFGNHKNAVVLEIMEAEERLQVRTARYWNELDLEYHDFDSREQMTAAVQAIDQASFLRFFDQHILGSNQHQLLVTTLGTNHKGQPIAPAQSSRVITEPATFLDAHRYFPRAVGLPRSTLRSGK